MEGWQAIVASDLYIILTTWVPGFDRAGAKDLKKLVGSRKWIGMAGQDITVTVLTSMLTIPLDLWVAFTYLGLPYVSYFSTTVSLPVAAPSSSISISKTSLAVN